LNESTKGTEMTKTKRMPSLVAMSMVAVAVAQSRAEVVAHWRFEEVAKLDGSRAASVVGESLTATDQRATNPRPYSHDETGKGNYLQVFEPRNASNPSKTVFADDVPTPQANGQPNRRSLALKGREYNVTLDRVLAFSDLQSGWTIEASVMTRRPEDEQVFLAKGSTTKAQNADLAIGYDPKAKKFYVDVKGGDGVSHRVTAGDAPETGKWYDLRAAASFDAKAGESKLEFTLKRSGEKEFGPSASTNFKGTALSRGAAPWAVGRGFPSGKFVADGGIDEVRISGEGLPRQPGHNPLFTDSFTADPAALVVGDTVYAYVGRDNARVGQFFVMNEWLCYSSKDMKTWTPHGTILRPEEFKFARRDVAWAAQMVPKDDKYYFYTTLRRTNNEEHCIGVAVGDSPTGPFKDARGTPLITDDMTKDSKRTNADIDPTVFIDVDGTAWMAWGNGDCYLAKLKPNMIELDGPIQKLSMTNYAEGPWLFKRGAMYYNVYAAEVPGTSPEQIGYATAPKITGPWTYRGILTGPPKTGFTIHPAVIEFKNQWYFFYHDGSTTLKGMPGGDCRRSVCLEYLYFNPDGTIQPIVQTREGVSVEPRREPKP
jgi:hypothetical protein